jgi:hypothetical protein
VSSWASPETIVNSAALPAMAVAAKLTGASPSTLAGVVYAPTFPGNVHTV